MADPEPPTDPEILLRVNREQSQRIAILEQQVDYLKRQLFGSKSEKHPTSHPELFDPEAAQPKKDEASDAGHPGEEAAPEEERKRSKKRRPIRARKLPRNLPVVEEEIIPSEVAANRECYRRMGEEVSDRLEKEPGYFYLKRTIRPKFVRRDHPFESPVIAPARPALIENGFWGDGLLSEILTNKYVYHLPYYRQEQLYAARHGIELSRKTMADATGQASAMFQAVTERMKQNILAGGYVQADETPKVYLERGKGGGSSQGYFWVYRGLEGEVVLDWQTTREHRHVAEWLGPDFEGILQSDGYEAYASYVLGQVLRGKKVRRAACLAHIRRKFEQSLEQRPALANWFLKVMGRLYGIEQTLREHQAPAEVRARVREGQSRRILELLKKATMHLLTRGAGILPKSNLGKALRYAQGQWTDMETYLEDGRVHVDNNLCENAIRPTAIGKKNDLFVGEANAGQRSAIIYGLVISAKAQGVDPQAYLRDLVKRLPKAKTSDLDELTPVRWAEAYKARRQAEEQAEATTAA